MIARQEEVPLINLAPNRDNPLSLWNPLDYGLLLYWVFFFPQALRWYVKKFTKIASLEKQANSHRERLKIIWQDAALRNFYIQAVIVTIVTAFAIGVVLTLSNVPFEWRSMLISLACSVFIAVRFRVVFGVTGGVGFGVAVGLAGGVGFGVADSVASGAAFTLCYLILLFRPAEFILFFLYHSFIPDSRLLAALPCWSRSIILPQPRIKRILSQQLESNWLRGVHNAHQLVHYSRQSIIVVRALKIALEKTREEDILFRAASLTDGISNWRLFLALTISTTRLVCFPFPQPIPQTPAQWACAGFWHWREINMDEAEDAFFHIRHLPHGPELLGVARLLKNAIQVKTPAALADWGNDAHWLNEPPEPGLRPGTLRALRILRSVCQNARAAQNAHSPLNRSLAINSGMDQLTILEKEGASFCPEPEWGIFPKFISNWKDILIHTGGAISEETLRQPALNPYEGFSGHPVLGTTFVGREGITERIKTRCAPPGQTPAIVLFGHRRMGKTSILRYLDLHPTPGLYFAYLNMQLFAMAQHSGCLLQDFAETILKTIQPAKRSLTGFLDPLPFSDSYTGRRSFSRLLDALHPLMTPGEKLILAIDEFELIQEAMAEGKLDSELLGYLRAVNHQYPWLGFIFAGLHTLEEMGGAYYSHFYSQAEYFRVSYLDEKNARKLIRAPHPDFALEYRDDAVDEILSLTGGQPFLLQRLCWELVHRWNEKFLGQRQETPRFIKKEDIPPVLTGDFFTAGAYYFEGVWNQAQQDEQVVMRILAASPTPLSVPELLAIAQKTDNTVSAELLNDTLSRMRRHDIITAETDAAAFASRLLKEWVNLKKNPLSTDNAPAKKTAPGF